MSSDEFPKSDKLGWICQLDQTTESNTRYPQQIGFRLQVLPEYSDPMERSSPAKPVVHHHNSQKIVGTNYVAGESYPYQICLSKKIVLERMRIKS